MSKERDLIAPGITSRGGTWAEMGSGTGIFTRTLYGLVGPEAEIYSVDRDAQALREQRAHFDREFPGAVIHYQQGDFTLPLALPPLDGVLMANALHFVPYRQQQDVLRQIVAYLRPGGRLILVEYGARRGNPWVPYPFDYAMFEELARGAGLRDIRRLASVPSRFLNEMYAACGVRP